ncbi:MAG: hypothetical protein R3236_00400 [Phycisphaeraceae bacterium]|nr:hypothetical protein [Phycisphaeraceae bacterium]
MNVRDQLAQRLVPIARRDDKLRLWRQLAAVWAVAATAAAVLFFAWRGGMLSGPSLLGPILAAAGFGSLWTVMRYRSRPTDEGRIARRIEAEHPDLQALLLTAVEQEPKDGRSMSFLQQRVVREALDHAERSGWEQAAPASRLRLAMVVASVSLLVLGLFSWRIVHVAALEAGRQTVSHGGMGHTESRITVRPGDVEAERGSSVVVTAAFDGPLPEAVDLYVESDPAEPARRIGLSKMLEDPIFGGTIYRIDRDLRYHLRYGPHRTETFTIRTYEHPRLLQADATIEFPEYADRPAQQLSDVRRLSLPKGATVTWEMTFNKPLASGRFLDDDQQSIHLAAHPTDPNRYQLRFTPQETRRFELHLEDAEGRKNKLPPRFWVEVHPNTPPKLKLVFPKKDQRVSPLQEVALEAEATDDHGLLRVGVTYTLSGRPAQDVTLGEDLSVQATVRHQISLESLGAEPDQLLSYHFWAEDLRADGTKRRTQSDLFFAEVRPFEEIFREGAAPPGGGQSGGRQQQKLIELQKQIVSAVWNLKRQTESGRRQKLAEDLGVVGGSQTEAITLARTAATMIRDPRARAALDEAVGHMQTTVERLTMAAENPDEAVLEPSLASARDAYASLLKMRARLHMISRTRQSQGGGQQQRRNQQLQQLELKQKDQRYETKNQQQNRQQQTARREDRQVLNRLRELARRQQDLGSQLNELRAALQQENDPQEKQELLRQLKRLQQQQRQLLRDVDELRQRMDRPANRQRMAEARRRLEKTRQRVREAAEALQRGSTAEAAPATARASQQLKQLKDEFQKKVSSEFEKEIRQLRQEARRLADNQKDITDRLSKQETGGRKQLDGGSGRAELEKQLNRQERDVRKLLDEAKDLTEKSEPSEPILSRKLYKAVREARDTQLNEAIKLSRQLVRQQMLKDAARASEHARDATGDLKKNIEEAARSVLGDEVDALRHARNNLNRLIDQARKENPAARNKDSQAAAGQNPPTPRAGKQTGDRPGEKKTPPPNQQARAEGQGPSPGRTQPPNQPGQEAQGQGAESKGSADSGQGRSPGNRQAEAQNPTENQGSGSGPGSPSTDAKGSEARQPGTPQQASAGGSNRGGGGNFFDQWDGGRNNPGPITGDRHREFSDRLRDVEESLEEPRLRNRAARIRDEARSMRAEFRRHGKQPQWDSIEQKILKPLTELKGDVEQALSRLESKRPLVPIDRDPVPGRFSDLSKRYYQNLSESKNEKRP